MGVTCPVCGTENRSVAKFCIECIGSLPMNFAATEILSHLPEPPYAARGITPATELGARAHVKLPSTSGFIAARGIASVGPAAPGTVLAPQTPPTSSGPYRTVERRKGLWVSVAALAIALIIGAAGWMVAGAGGLYIYAFGHSNAGGEPEVSMVTVPAAATATAMPAVGALAPLTPLPPLAALAAPAASAVVAASINTAPRQSAVMSPAPSATSAAGRTTAKPTAAPTTPVRQIGATAATTATAGPTAAADPNAQCTGLGFFAASRCIHAQCAKAEYSAHSTCAAVRQQQRLMEEKRNPTMAN